MLKAARGPLLARPLAIAALATLAAGCGSGPERPDEPPEAVFAEALRNTPSGEARADVTLSGRTGRVALEGPFALRGGAGAPVADLEFEAELADAGAEGRLISTGDRAFVDFFGETYRVEPERLDALAAELDRVAQRLVKRFRRARYGEVEEAGGVDAVAIEPRSAPRDVTVWVGIDDRTIRRVATAVRLAPVEMVELDAEITDPGARVTVNGPPGGPFQPLADLLDRIAAGGRLAP